MGSPWKAISDDSRREILLLLKKKDMVPTEIAEYFNFTLPALSSHLRILKDADLITEKKQWKNRPKSGFTILFCFILQTPIAV